MLAHTRTTSDAIVGQPLTLPKHRLRRADRESHLLTAFSDPPLVYRFSVGSVQRSGQWSAAMAIPDSPATAYRR